MGMYQPVEMFDSQKMAQEVFNLTKDYTANTMKVMKSSMATYENALDTIMKHGMVINEGSKKLFSDWTDKAKLGQKNYWNMLENNLNNMGTFFTPSGNNTDTKRATAN
jgi:hypothetical protein